MEAAQVNITNILRWSEQHKKFVMSRDIYDSGTDFRALEIGRVTLHPGEFEDVGFVRCEGQRVEFNGKMDDQGQSHYPRWTAQNPPLIDTSKPAISDGRPRPVEFYFVASSGRKSVWTLVRQLRGPHLRTCA